MFQLFLLCRFVSLLPKGEVFVVFCFFLRVVMAFGGAAADTASFAIVAGEFGAKIGVVMVSHKFKTTEVQQLEQYFRQVFFYFVVYVFLNLVFTVANTH